MNNQEVKKSILKGPAKLLLILSALLLIVSFFLPWVKWDGTPVSGAAMASGDFFGISSGDFGLANPFPAIGGLTGLLWAIPLFGMATLVISFAQKRLGIIPAVTGVMVLGLVTMYELFSRTLADLGIRYDPQPAIYLAFISGAGLVLCGTRHRIAKVFALIGGPLIIYFLFSLATKHIEGQVYEDTSTQPSAYTIDAMQLLAEFRLSDSAANARYREQIITVSGRITSIEFPDDSTATIKFEDSTGSYAIFPFGKEELPGLKTYKAGQPVTIKASCSGGVYSDILEMEVVTFKRCTLLKK